MKQSLVLLTIIVMLASPVAGAAYAQSAVPWYTEGDFAPAARIAVTLENTLDFDRHDCPVIIRPEDMPVRALHEMWVTIVDPSLPPKEPPSREELAFVGGHGIREETNGHQIFRQLDDLDKDGVWDELFFQTDIEARSKKTIYIYLGFSQRGWNEHGSHATIGSYCRHIIPWWESGNIGWKLWYPTTVDMYGKRKPLLMSWEMCINNLCGYNGVPVVNHDYGSDIMRVADSFGAGAICLFECPAIPDSVSRPRFTPASVLGTMSPVSWNEDQISDTRYAFDVVVNGPCRSMIKVKTMNWLTGGGVYELEQYYTAYTNQSYSTCRVVYTTFLPLDAGTTFGCGIRRNLSQYFEFRDGGLVMSGGKDNVTDPDDDTGQRGLEVQFIGTALVVKDEFSPEYRFVKQQGGNHTFSVPVNDKREFEYMIAGAWEYGAVYNTPESFKEYMVKTAKEYNNPLRMTVGNVEKK